MSRVFLFTLLAFTQISFAQQALQYRWHFASAENVNEQKHVLADSTNYLDLSNDSTFEFLLTSKNASLLQGKWYAKNDSLFLTTSTDSTYFYKILTVNDSLLTLAQGNTQLEWHRTPKNSSAPVALPLNYDFSKGDITLKALLRGMLGLVVLVGIGFILSSKRRKINWPLIIKGLIIQIIFALGILKVPFIKACFDWVSEKFVILLSFTREGSEFLFGNLISDTESLGYIFAFQVLPTVIFFSALTSLLFYWGILQKIVFAFAWIMKRTMKLSGAESLAAAGNIFLGQTESPLLIKPYIKKMTRSELLCIMSGGMATIAGGVLAAYIGFLGGTEMAQQVFFAKHLLAASVMSAPAAVVAAKLMLPETEKVNESMHIEKANIGSNALEAITNGTTEGLKLAVNVGAMLLVFIAFIAFANYLLTDFLGDILGLNAVASSLSNGQYDTFSLQFILGYTLKPITWLMGVDTQDAALVGQLLGEKTILNEFVAYVSLGDLMKAGSFASEKSIIIATYILCGFSNFASIGIQIGGIGSLAPSRKGDLSKLGFRALIAGTLASLFTAVIVGMLI